MKPLKKTGIDKMLIADLIDNDPNGYKLTNYQNSVMASVLKQRNYSTNAEENVSKNQPTFNNSDINALNTKRQKSPEKQGKF